MLRQLIGTVAACDTVSYCAGSGPIYTRRITQIRVDQVAGNGWRSRSGKEGGGFNLDSLACLSSLFLNFVIWSMP